MLAGSGDAFSDNKPPMGAWEQPAAIGAAVYSRRGPVMMVLKNASMRFHPPRETMALTLTVRTAGIRRDGRSSGRVGAGPRLIVVDERPPPSRAIDLLSGFHSATSALENRGRHEPARGKT